MIEPPASETSSFPAITVPTGKTDLASAVAALQDGRTGRDCATRHWLGRPARRAILTLTFVVLLIGGAADLFTSTSDSDAVANGSRASIVYRNAQRGACLNWPPGSPDKPSFVQCRANHMFEVASPLGANDGDEPCRRAVREYLGARYDPAGKFTVLVLRADDGSGEPTALCGFQLPGTQGQPVAFKGNVAELDQSRVWPVGTCLGIDSADRSTDLPVDCASPHALEVTGVVDATERFPGAAPAEADQRAYLAEVCTMSADAYLAPATLLSVGLSPGYEPLSPASWAAGSRQVSCNVGRPSAQGWTPVAGSMRALSPADVPVPPPAPPSPAEPPPVYQEPLVPIVSPPPPAPTTTSPAPTSTPPVTTTPATTPPATTPPATPSTPPPAAPPPPAEPTPTEPAPEPGVIRIPGLPPIYLPGYVPPAPDPIPSPSGPAPGPPVSQ